MYILCLGLSFKNSVVSVPSYILLQPRPPQKAESPCSVSSLLTIAVRNLIIRVRVLMEDEHRALKATTRLSWRFLNVLDPREIQALCLHQLICIQSVVNVPIVWQSVLFSVNFSVNFQMSSTHISPKIWVDKILISIL